MSGGHGHSALAQSERRIELLVAGDLAGVAELLDDALVYVHSTGLVQSKAASLAFFAEVLQVTAVQREPRFQSEGKESGTVCLGFVQSMHAHLRREPGRSIKAHSYFSEVWRICGGSWRLVHAQSTALPAEAEGQR